MIGCTPDCTEHEQQWVGLSIQILEQALLIDPRARCTAQPDWAAALNDGRFDVVVKRFFPDISLTKEESNKILHSAN
jgi:hypothetical protein